MFIIAYKYYLSLESFSSQKESKNDQMTFNTIGEILNCEIKEDKVGNLENIYFHRTKIMTWFC